VPSVLSSQQALIPFLTSRPRAGLSGSLGIELGIAGRARDATRPPGGALSKSKKLKKAHHIQSEFYLRRFTVPAARAADADGFWVYRRGQGTPTFLPPETTAIRSHFYSYRDDSGQRNDGMENLLGKVESRIAPIIAGLTAPGGFPPTDQDRRYVAFFAALAFVRTPKMRRWAVAMFEREGLPMLRGMADDETKLRQSVERYNAQKGTTVSLDDAREGLTTILAGLASGDVALTLRERAQVGVPLTFIEPMLGIMLGLHWSLLEAPPGAEFVTSDNPVVMAHAPAGQPLDRDMELTFPLDSRHCLLLTRGAPDGAVLPCHRKHLDDVVRRTTVQAEREVYASHKNPVVARHLR
jgi:Protein of unknown function (DUF4238)